MRRVLIDSAVPLYALGEPSPWKQSCIDVLRQITTDQVMAFASVEMIQEVLHHRLRKTSDRNQAVTQARDVATLMTLLPFDVRILDESLQLISAHPVIRGRDAVHAATAVAHGIPEIISPDPAFDGIPGLRRTFPGT